MVITKRTGRQEEHKRAKIAVVIGTAIASVGGSSAATLIGDKIPGLNRGMIVDYIRYLVNLRSEGLGFGLLYEGGKIEPSIHGLDQPVQQ